MTTEYFVAMEGDGYELLKTVDGAYQGCVGVFKTDKAACRKLKLIETAKCAEPTILFV